MSTDKTKKDEARIEAIEFNRVRIDVQSMTVEAKFKAYDAGGEHKTFIYEEKEGKRTLKKKIAGGEYKIFKDNAQNHDIEALLPKGPTTDSVVSKFTGRGITTIEEFTTAMAQFAMGSTVGARYGYDSGVDMVCEKMLNL